MEKIHLLSLLTEGKAQWKQQTLIKPFPRWKAAQQQLVV